MWKGRQDTGSNHAIPVKSVDGLQLEEVWIVASTQPPIRLKNGAVRSLSDYVALHEVEI